MFSFPEWCSWNLQPPACRQVFQSSPICIQWFSVPVYRMVLAFALSERKAPPSSLSHTSATNRGENFTFWSLSSGADSLLPSQSLYNRNILHKQSLIIFSLWTDACLIRGTLHSEAAPEQGPQPSGCLKASWVLQGEWLRKAVWKIRIGIQRLLKAFIPEGIPDDVWYFQSHWLEFILGFC